MPRDKTSPQKAPTYTEAEIKKTSVSDIVASHEELKKLQKSIEKDLSINKDKEISLQNSLKLQKKQESILGAIIAKENQLLKISTLLGKTRAERERAEDQLYQLQELRIDLLKKEKKYKKQETIKEQLLLEKDLSKTLKDRDKTLRDLKSGYKWWLPFLKFSKKRQLELNKLEIKSVESARRLNKIKHELLKKIEGQKEGTKERLKSEKQLEQILKKQSEYKRISESAKKWKSAKERTTQYQSPLEMIRGIGENMANMLGDIPVIGDALVGGMKILGGLLIANTKYWMDFRREIGISQRAMGNWNQSIGESESLLIRMSIASGRSLNKLKDISIKVQEARLDWDSLGGQIGGGYDNFTGLIALWERGFGVSSQSIIDVGHAIRFNLGITQEETAQLSESVLDRIGGINKEFHLGARGIEGMLGMVQKMTPILAFSTKQYDGFSKMVAKKDRFKAGADAIMGFGAKLHMIGIEATRAGEMVMNMMDVDRISENALKISIMGLDMIDILSMNAENITNQMNTGMTNLRNFLMGGDRIFQNIMLKQMGYSTEEAVKIMGSLHDPKSYADAMKEVKKKEGQTTESLLGELNKDSSEHFDRTINRWGMMLRSIRLTNDMLSSIGTSVEGIYQKITKDLVGEKRDKLIGEKMLSSNVEIKKMGSTWDIKEQRRARQITMEMMGERIKKLSFLYKQGSLEEEEKRKLGQRIVELTTRKAEIKDMHQWSATDLRGKLSKRLGEIDREVKMEIKTHEQAKLNTDYLKMISEQSKKTTENTEKVADESEKSNEIASAQYKATVEGKEDREFTNTQQIWEHMARRQGGKLSTGVVEVGSHSV